MVKGMKIGEGLLGAVSGTVLPARAVMMLGMDDRSEYRVSRHSPATGIGGYMIPQVRRQS